MFVSINRMARTAEGQGLVYMATTCFLGGMPARKWGAAKPRRDGAWSLSEGLSAPGKQGGCGPAQRGPGTTRRWGDAPRSRLPTTVTPKSGSPIGSEDCPETTSYLFGSNSRSVIELLPINAPDRLAGAERGSVVRRAVVPATRNRPARIAPDAEFRSHRYWRVYRTSATYTALSLPS